MPYMDKTGPPLALGKGYKAGISGTYPYESASRETTKKDVKSAFLIILA
jgi:hypothetical protein